MNYESKIKGTELAEQCEMLISNLVNEMDLYKQQVVIMHKFIDNDFQGDSVQAIKEKLVKIVEIAEMLIEADEKDILDLQTLKNYIYEVNIDGYEVIESKNEARDKKEECLNSAQYFDRMASIALFDWERTYFSGLSNTQRGYAQVWNNIYLKWEELEKLYDEIDYETKTLFYSGAELRQGALKRLQDLKGSDKNDLTHKLSVSRCKKRGNEITVEKANEVEERIYNTVYNILTDLGYTNEEIQYLFENYPALMNSLYATSCYSTTDMYKILVRVKYLVKIETIEVYAIVGTDADRLTQEQIYANAEYIYYYLRNKGWSKEAICALLGNMYEESKLNPGVWQYLNNEQYGYGLVQFSTLTNDEDKNNIFLEWLSEQGYSPNELVQENPKLMIDLQLEYIVETSTYALGYECQSWYTSDAFQQYFDMLENSKYANDVPEPTSFSLFTQSTASPAGLALIFEAAYERSSDTIEEKDERADSALVWYEYFRDFE